MLWNGFKIAFSMYSKIPMPKTDWTKENMKYAMCFFPLVGIPIGLVIYLWWFLCHQLSIGVTLFSVGMTLIPLFITGGIHLDGFLDTMDAKSSYQPIERKLEILKDPHAGAFAIISCSLYLLLTFGLWSELYTSKSLLPIVMIGYILSRAFSGFSVVTFTCAKNSGLLATFSDQAQKKNVRLTMLGYLIVFYGIMIGFHMVPGLLCIVTGGLVFLYYRLMSYKRFGGITGDLAGYFLQLFEVMILFTVVFYEKVVMLWI